MKAEEPEIGQRHEDMENKWEYYHIFSPRKDSENLHQEGTGTNEHSSDETLQQNSLPRVEGPINKQHTYQSINQLKFCKVNVMRVLRLLPEKKTKKLNWHELA